MKGYVQVYTGDGKGKTTAALGLAMRAFGAGLNIYMAQFVKGMKYSEQETFKVLSEHLTVKLWPLCSIQCLHYRGILNI